MLGAKHWKFGGNNLRALRNKATATSKTTTTATVGEMEEEDELAATAATTRKPSSKGKGKSNNNNKEGYFDFDSPWLSRDMFALPSKKSRSNITVITTQQQQKQQQQAKEGGFDLPPDAKLKVKDLCRLFLIPFVVVPPTRSGYGKLLTSQLTLDNNNGGINNNNNNGSGSDRVWGVPTQIQQQQQQQSLSYNNDNNKNKNENDVDDDDDVGGGHFDYGGDDDYNEQFHAPVDNNDNNNNALSSTTAAVGLEINNNNLLKASRVVEKVKIDYATVSTKVNVKKLKADIWQHIHHNIKQRNPSTAAATGENDSENVDPRESLSSPTTTTTSKGRGSKRGKDEEKEMSLSFRQLIHDVGEKQEQQNVSLPFYFICLLHLANEKTLEIHNTPKMDDLIIEY